MSGRLQKAWAEEDSRQEQCPSLSSEKPMKERASERKSWP
jgi:hypothetical protein